MFNNQLTKLYKLLLEGELEQAVWVFLLYVNERVVYNWLRMLQHSSSWQAELVFN